MRRLLLAGVLAPLVTLGLLLFMAGLVRQDRGIGRPEQAPPYLELVMSEREETLEHKIRRQPKPPRPEPAPQSVASPRPQPATPGAPVKLALPSLGLATQVAALPIPTPGVMDAPEPAPAPGPVTQAQTAIALPLLRVEPRYPTRALRRRKEGYVVLSFTINRHGRVEAIQVVEAQPENWFEEAAIQALHKWKYKPMVVNGQPVAQPGQTIKLEFVMGS